MWFLQLVIQHHLGVLSSTCETPGLLDTLRRSYVMEYRLRSATFIGGHTSSPVSRAEISVNEAVLRRSVTSMAQLFICRQYHLGIESQRCMVPKVNLPYRAQAPNNTL